MFSHIDPVRGAGSFHRFGVETNTGFFWTGYSYEDQYQTGHQSPGEEVDDSKRFSKELDSCF